MTSPNRLPLSTTGFEKIRREKIYVDKTALILRFAERRDGFLLLRPPRFGKSLLVNTLKSLFQKGLADFQGLAIEPRWKDTTYPVVLLRFTPLRHCHSEARLAQRLDSLLLEAFWPAGFRLNANRPTSLLDQLASWLDSLPAASLVVLIDDYDAPLATHLHHPSLLAAVSARLAEVFAVLKQCENCLRFFFMTGVTRLSDYGLSDELNHLTDLTHAPAFASLLGFTRKEVAHNFAPFVTRAAKQLGLTSDRLLTELERRCGGHVFSSDCKQRVLSPGAALRFLHQPTAAITDDFALPPMALPQPDGRLALDCFDTPQAVTLAQLTGSQAPGSQGRNVLLTQTGILSIKTLLPNGLCLLHFPNEATMQSMAQWLCQRLLAQAPLAFAALAALPDLLAQDQIYQALPLINDALIRIDSELFSPATSEDVAHCLQLLLIGGAAMPASSVSLNAERSELTFTARCRRFCLSIRFLSAASQHPDKDSMPLLVDAIHSLARSAPQANPIALVYGEKARCFIRWQNLPYAEF